VFALFRLASTQKTRSQHVRIVLEQGTGRGWSRPSDHFGLAIVVNGLSHDHEEYLSLGGRGFSRCHRVELSSCRTATANTPSCFILTRSRNELVRVPELVLLQLEF